MAKPGSRSSSKTEADESPPARTARTKRAGSQARPRRRTARTKAEADEGLDGETAPSAAPSSTRAPTPPKKRRAPRKRRAPSPAARAEKITKLRGRIAKLQLQLADLTDQAGDEAGSAAPRGQLRTSEDPEPTAAVEPSPSTPRPVPVGWNRAVGSDPTRELLTSDYFVRQWGRLGVRRRSEELDQFGLDNKVEGRLEPVLNLLLSSYFRAQVEGVHHIPGTGRCLLVANHSGGPVPYDGLLLRAALKREHPNHREVRWLSEDLFHHLPFVGVFMSRLGAVRACQENAQRLLGQGYAVAVFPEGVKGVGKLYKNRYRLQRFGRGGYIRLCIRTHTPLIPCAIMGAEDANPMLYRMEYLTRFLGVPYVPITPTFPWLGPLGLLPAPTKLTVRFGEPVYFDGYSPEAADDEVLVGRLSDRVRATIQGMLDDALAKRQSVFFG